MDRMTTVGGMDMAPILNGTAKNDSPSQEQAGRGERPGGLRSGRGGQSRSAWAAVSRVCRSR
jgi:hypothetical protein